MNKRLATCLSKILGYVGTMTLVLRCVPLQKMRKSTIEIQGGTNAIAHHYLVLEVRLCAMIHIYTRGGDDVFAKRRKITKEHGAVNPQTTSKWW